MKIFYLAGINNSEPEHWQSLWHRRLGGEWIDHSDWAHPSALEWVEDLEKALQMNPGPKVFLAHSIGCLLAAEWARNRRDPGVAGAFLVAPPDPRGPNYPRDAGGFGSPFEVVLPFPSFVAASRNDPYSSFDYSRRLAEQWKSRFLDAGEKGHIHLKSNLGFWNEGWEWFGEFLAAIGYPPAAGN